MSPARRQRLATLAAVAAAIAIVPLGVWHLGFARDDWNHYVNMRDLHQHLPWWDAVHLIASNDWFGAHELRIFFGAYLTDYLVAPAGALASPIIYTVQLSMHVAAACIIGYLTWRQTRSQLLAVSVLLLVTYFPVVTQPALWINNLFFVQPWFLLWVTIALLLRSKGQRWLNALWASLAAIACLFSGEATISLLFACLLAAIVVHWRRRHSTSDALVAAVPLVSASVALFVYLEWVVTRPAGRDLDWSALSNLPTYLDGAKSQFLSLVDLGSPEYGAFSVPISGITIATTAFVLLFAGVGVWGAIDACGVHQRRLLLLTGVGLGALVISAAPMALGMVTGSRPGPDLRYLYVPAAVLVITVSYAVYTLLGLVRPARPLAFRLIVSLILGYAVLTTTYNIVDIWGFQRRVDAAIWARVDEILSPSTKAIVTFNPNHMYLMAPYHSNAVSDFQADWGVAARIAWLHPDWVRPMLFRDAAIAGQQVHLRDYYGDGSQCFNSSQIDPADSIIYLTYDYGPRFADLLSSPLLVTSDYEAFVASRDEILKRHPDAQRWAAPAECVTS